MGAFYESFLHTQQRPLDLGAGQGQGNNQTINQHTNNVTT